MASVETNGKRAPRRGQFGSEFGPDPRECGRLGGKAPRRRRGQVDADELLAQLVSSGAKQGVSAAWRVLERQRGEEQLALHDAVERREAAEAELAELERQLPALRAEVADLFAIGNEEALRITALESEYDEREAELRKRAATDAGLVDLLADIGEAAVARACGQLGWIEPEESDARLA
jgi:hypothetical protein